MKRRLVKTAIVALAITLTAGCTSLQGPAMEEPPSQRTRNAVLAVGAALVVAALLVTKAKSNTKDSIRDLAPNPN